MIALAALLVSRLTDDSHGVDDVARVVFYVALTVWAYEEAASGVNGFRKAIGAITLLLIVVSIALSVS